MDSSGEVAAGQDGHLDLRSSPGRSDLSGLYHLGRTLGRGHFAVVKLARHFNTGQLVAVKMIDKTKLDVMATSHLLQEVRCMRLVQHPNVVRLYEVIDTPTTLYLIMELAEGGDLYDYILRHEAGVAEGTAKRHFAQIVRAVAYCHQLHVVHRDLKPENVVFFPQQGAVKLTDFGFSNLFQPGTMLATSCGSLAYSAPEILLGEEYDAPAVDIWSLGVILYMLVCGVPPFQETNDSETLVMILDCRYSIPERVSGDCRDLISRMLQKDPCRRASLEEIQAHDWLQGLDNVLLSPEAPPHWLSGALSLSSPRSGVPECGDLLAARPPPQQAFPGPWQPSLTLTLRPPPAEEPPVTKNLPALQQICEEEEEEEEEEGERLASLLMTEPVTEAEQMLDDADHVMGEEESGSSAETIEEEEEEKADVKMEIERKDSGCVISDQPVSHGDKSVSETPEGPSWSLPGLVVPCCQGQPDSTAEDGEEEAEPNNNTNKLPPSVPASSASLDCKEASKAAREGEEKTEDGARDDLLTDRSQPHNALGEAAPRVEQGKRHSLKLRERLFQFPLCEKALALNMPAHNKPKILPLAQYNCCHVL
ncbi:SNF related kinase b isoform X1 [Hippoglossus hippoglossus]|uniref:SNF related kinase b isoform X1 n=1 Tax=Hippoglossus hippoglossus TaxID=8267 RepID=UPI00148E6F03|nr:SNF related kinase b isoform X1 [Hippoglossus hippoglossus]XP_034443451.1 SNF related kinase b isoform X1 [Hippoglossus hippoglossus]